MAVHAALDYAGILPYPLLTTLVVGSCMTAVISGAVGYYFMWLVGCAIRDLAANRDEFRRLSETDYLTGLLNRRSFFGDLAPGPSQSAFIVFDIDYFKPVNDRFGHGAGDDVICAVGHLLTGVFSLSSGRVGRIGGEEFAVSVANITRGESMRLANQARLAVCSRPIETRVGPIHVTISGGHAYQDPDRPIEDIFGACDDALYCAKALGRDCVVDCDDARLAKSHAGNAGSSPCRDDAKSNPVVWIPERVAPDSNAEPAAQAA